MLHPEGVQRLTLSTPFELLAGATRWPEALAGTDLGRIALELDGAMRRRGARTQAQPTDVLLAHGRMGATLASSAFEGERVLRAVVTHVRAPPFFAGLSIVVHPRPEYEAPLLVADLTIAPTGHARALVDACGPSITARGFSERFGAPLAQVVDSTGGMRRTTVPAWLAPLSGAGGGTLRAARGGAEGLGRLLLRYTDRYLSALEGAPRVDASATRANAAAARSVANLMRAHGPARRHLAKVFGDRSADKTMSLIWCED